MSAALERRPSERKGWRLVDVPLVGAAPWGFTLMGGREHQEPLVITKVEEGSEAETAQLRVGDELVSVNGVVLSGYRQEAICLVKSSYKTLSLVVRRRIVSVSRHHSCHPTKVTDNQAESARTQTMPIPVREMRYDSSSSDWKRPGCWDPNIVQQVSSSLSSMDYIEQSSHGYCSKGLRNSTDNTDSLVGSLYGSAYSSFSTCSTAMNQSLTSENMTYKPSQWDSNSGVSNVRLPHRSNTSQHVHEWPGFQQLSINTRSPESSKTQDPTEYNNSSSERPPLGPVWHIPIKKSKAPSPPQASSDSFALTRAHEKGWTLDVPGSDGLDFHVSQKSQDQGLEKGLSQNNDITHIGHINNRRGAGVKPSSTPPFKSDTMSPYTSPDSHNNDHLIRNNHHSLNSTDLQQGKPVCNPVLHDQHKVGNEITHFPQTSYTSVSKPHNWSSSYSNVEEFPADNITPLFKYAHVTSSAAVSSTSISENLDHSKHSQNCFMTAQQSVHSLAVPQASVKVGDIERGTGHKMGDHSSVDFQNVNKKNFLLSQEQQLYLESDEYEHNSGQVRNQSPHLGVIVETPPEKPKTENRKSSGKSGEIQETVDPQGRKEMQATQNSHSTGSEWFVNSLNSEVQTRRTQVQKNKIIATVTDSRTKEDETVCKDEGSCTPLSSPEGSISYKNHLKAAQARVLRATSFSRKDLDPMLPDHLGGDVSDGDIVPYLMHQDKTSMHACSKVLQDEPSPANVQVPRLGGRKRFPVEQKMHSFSAPDRINEVGVEDEIFHPEADRSSVNEHRELETTDKPALPRSMMRSAKQSSPVDHPEVKSGRKLHPGKMEEGYGKTKAPFRGHPLGKSHSSFSSFDRVGLQGSKWQRAPAGHQNTRNIKKNPLELVTPGTSLSTDKVQDKHVDKLNKPSYTYKNHDTSTSEDFYEKNHPVRERGFTDSSLPEPARQEKAARLYDRRHSDSTSPDVLEPPTENTPMDDPEKRTLFKHPYRHPSEKPHLKDPEQPSGWSPSKVFHEHSAHKKKGPLEQKQCQSNLDGLKATAPLKDPQESSHGSRNDQASKHNSPCAELPLDLVVPWGSLAPCENPHQGIGPEDELGALERARVSSSSFVECRLKLQLHTRSQQFSSHEIKVQVSVTIQDECRMDSMLENATVEEAAIMAFPAKDMEEEQHHHKLPSEVSSSHQPLAPNMGQRGLEHRAAESGVPGVSLQKRPHHFQRGSSQPGLSRTTEERWEKDIRTDAASKVTDSMFSSSTASAEESEEFQMGTKGMQDSELIGSLTRKLQVLREAQDSVQEDIRANNVLGEEVEQALRKLGKPSELDKFRMFVGDVDKVVSLLMSLTSRLDRVEKALSNLGEQVSPKEKHSLLEKRKQLIRQHQDARELKKNLDHREHLVYNILANYLSEDRLANYVHFVKMKSALIIEQRKLEDKIRLREEQLRVLMDRLPLESRYTSDEDLLFRPDLLI
ncbi:protein Shroom2-like isoform X1 [Scleropages formosus]|uniref:protein Shroom2-like isoform X1 n=1 Tax=Scleropages formosus TaxID=113540 RepID=UPI0010FA892D|nr:protein Shroom2-like isoform X1 [Scleropages formosus]XP_018584945.2 protein Shroom2-like isoform X1 [Scleropages formosus]